MTSKTLDQYTPEERQKMIGMWCDHDDQGRIKTSIIANLTGARNDEGRMEPRVITYWPEQCHWSIAGEELDTITPRFDLPRAWTPAGEPVPGEWDDDNGHNLMRRFHTEWEWKQEVSQDFIDQYEGREK